jgi:hypothetical protein
MLDAQCGQVPSSMLDCGAHMLLYLDEPQTMMQIGLAHLLERFAATRADVGFGSSCVPSYQAAAAQIRGDCNVPDMLGVKWPNRHHVLQSIWQSPAPVYLDVQDAFVGGL